MKELFKDLNVNLSDTEEEQFLTYYNFLIEENNKYNLTSIIEKNEVLVKHFYDSLTLLETNLFQTNKTVVDIGSGAGFPSIPLAIIKPHIKFTLVESQTKKANFLKALVLKLNLQNVVVVNQRSEDFVRRNFEKFDIATARAVAALNILSELSLPLVKVGGSFLAMKGLNYETELNVSKSGIIKLGGKVKNIVNISLPLQLGKRTIIIINKEKSVKGYPRAFKEIKKNPL